MFGIFCSRGECRSIHEGRVRCPLRRREVEVDLCAACGWQSALQLRDELPSVRCRADLVSTLPDLGLVD